MAEREPKAPKAEYNRAGERISQLVTDLELYVNSIEQFKEQFSRGFPEEHDITKEQADEEWMKKQLFKAAEIVNNLEKILNNFIEDKKQFEDLLIDKQAASRAHRLSASISTYLLNMFEAIKPVRTTMRRYLDALNIPRHAVDGAIINELNILMGVVNNNVNRFKLLLEVDLKLKAQTI